MKFDLTKKFLQLINDYEYKPSNPYKSLYANNPRAKRAWKIISNELSIIQMMLVTDICKKPALLGLDNIFYLDTEMKKEIKNEQFKKMCGEMAKQALGKRGYRVKNKLKIKGLFFKNATKYEKENV
jgi:hypothetical protein